tara:strand:+ start:68 stop:964 length:897 start_codon:yes stop_codon:yes gene_type:complete
MFSPDQYELLDFGEGRKLERFGDLIINRPSPPAEFASPTNPDRWSDADLIYERISDQAGEWKAINPLLAENLNPDGSGLSEWPLSFNAQFSFQLKVTPFGHVGVFVEQSQNWLWIADQVARQARRDSGEIRVLNLFAYTGGSTMAAAKAGASVVHIDSAKNVVQWARNNADYSSLGDAPIRWIAEDAMLFCQREAKRGNTYHGIILDPPSYGHGPKGQVWKIQQLPELLELCKQILILESHFILLSCHSPGVGPAELQAYLSQIMVGHCGGNTQAHDMEIIASDGRGLPSGCCARLIV